MTASKMIQLNGLAVRAVRTTFHLFLYGPLDNYQSCAAVYSIGNLGTTGITGLVPESGQALGLLPDIERKLSAWLGLGKHIHSQSCYGGKVGVLTCGTVA